jgi:hypothetical protein
MLTLMIGDAAAEQLEVVAQDTDDRDVVVVVAFVDEVLVAFEQEMDWLRCIRFRLLLLLYAGRMELENDLLR